MTISPPIRDEPTPLEKTIQLERIMLSATFHRQSKPSALLQRLVTDSLAGIVPEEHQLGIDLFERRRDWVTLDDAVVRQNMTRVRKLLGEYYDSDGIEDRLNLELLGYQAVFSYNPRNPVERNFRMALKYLATDPQVAFSYLDEVLRLEPDHADALAARGEAELWRLMIGNELNVPRLLEAAELQTQQAMRYDQACWRAHIVMGTVYVCRKEWKKAKQHFDSSVKSSPERAQFHPWYAGFLMAIGKTEEALELVKAVASGPITSPWPRLTHAVFLYAARRFTQARYVILEAKNEHPDIWLSHVIWSCVLIASGRQKSPVPLLGMSMLQSLPDGTVVYTALSLYEHLLRLTSDDPEYAELQGLLKQWISEKESALARPAEDNEPPPFREIRVSPFHLAIGYMALGDHARAVTLLRQDVARGHPLMAWLHLWPLFDPLRESPKFEQLIADMHIPNRASK